MDDDDLRRGRPTCHKAFDEATAILVGDSLQVLAFQVLASGSGIAARCRQFACELVRVAGDRQRHRRHGRRSGARSRSQRPAVVAGRGRGNARAQDRRADPCERDDGRGLRARISSDACDARSTLRARPSASRSRSRTTCSTSKATPTLLGKATGADQRARQADLSGRRRRRSRAQRACMNCTRRALRGAAQRSGSRAAPLAALSRLAGAPAALSAQSVGTRRCRRRTPHCNSRRMTHAVLPAACSASTRRPTCARCRRPSCRASPTSCAST